MRITLDDLNKAASRGLISPLQAQKLWGFFQHSRQGISQFHLIHVTYYFGALIVLVAMGWFLAEVWDQYKEEAALVVSSIYGLAFLAVGYGLWRRSGFQLVGGILVTLSVCMLPVVVYSVQEIYDLWPPRNIWGRESWLFMMSATIFAALTLLRFVRFSFLLVPAILGLWLMLMNLTPLLFGEISRYQYERCLVSAIFGAGMVCIAYFVDFKKYRQDFAFWCYLLGILTFWGGLSFIRSDGELKKFIYCMVNVAMIFGSVFFRRRIFMICGAMGCLGYLGYLARRIFRDSLMFPLALSLLGVAIIAITIWYQRNKEQVDSWLLNLLPSGIQSLRPPERG